MRFCCSSVALPEGDAAVGASQSRSLFAASLTLRRAPLNFGPSLALLLLFSVCLALDVGIASAAGAASAIGSSVSPLLRSETPASAGDEEDQLQPARIDEDRDRRVDYDGLLELERQMQNVAPNESRYSCLPPINTSTFPTFEYTQLSNGLCKLDVPRRKEFPTEARACARMCTADWKCYGFVVSQAEDCIHYYEKFLIPGGMDINGAYCHKQVNKSNGDGTKRMAYSPVGQGLCKMVPRLPEYDLCHNQTEASCKTLCDSKLDCYGYSVIPAEAFCLLYSEMDLRNGTAAYNGAKCMMKKLQDPDNITFVSEKPFHALPPPLPRSLPGPGGANATSS